MYILGFESSCDCLLYTSNYTITNFYPIGTSNEFIGETVEISVKDGALLLVITDKD